MFQFPGLASEDLFDSVNGSRAMKREGFPHSDIPGSQVVCAFPGLIAACHVLRRLLEPRHSPCALSSLTKILSREVFRQLLRTDTSVVRERSPVPIFGGTVKIPTSSAGVNGDTKGASVRGQCCRP
jgi:hypothetical protein